MLINKENNKISAFTVSGVSEIKKALLTETPFS
jgi:hypothetical protein